MLARQPFLVTAFALMAVSGPVSRSLAQDPAGWWSYRPLQRPAVPQVRDAASAPSDVDRFVLADLEAKGLQPSPPADKTTLIRRLTYDLLGLPPQPAEIDAFVQDGAADAYERLVERLLASPQYGVQYGRHWLDLVRYAETDSYERDNKKPEAWRYRDWVIEAINGDLPYAEFVRQQLAGDELPQPTVGSLVATGFYRLGIWDDEPTDAEQAIYDDYDSIADTTARTFLGVSMGCARCHDHKKDPITAVDYYSFLAFFEGVKPYRAPQGGSGLLPDNYTRTVPADGELDRHAAAMAAHATARQQLAARAQAVAAAAWQSLSPPQRVAACAQMDRGLVAHYTCDQASSTRLGDAVGGHDGTVIGQPVPVAGRFGGALEFDGDDAIALPAMVQDSFTVSFWVASNHAGSGRDDDPRWFTGDGLVDGDVDGAQRDWGISWIGNGRIAAGTGAPDTFVASPPGNADGSWHHVVFTRERRSGRFALFVDGAFCGEAKGNQERLDAPPQLLVGAMRRGDHFFHGRIDDLRCYDRALAAEEVLSLWLDLRGGIAAPAILQAQPPATGGGNAVFAEFAALQAPQLHTVRVLCAQEAGAVAPPSFVRVRGNAHQRGVAVAPSVPAVLGGGSPPIVPPANGRSSGRRSALAAWITAADNPLSWRVLANRLWQWHFGRGLARTPNDFGRLGEAPTHPQLLDWLACEAVARGGSLKAMHRLLVTSASYRMASAPDAPQAAVDPRNDHCWRFDRRRLFAEEVRDSMLAAAGVLNLELGGPGVFPPLPRAVLATASRPDEAWGESPPAQAARRSAYVHVKRSLLEPLLAVFDLADTDTSCPVRFATVQPTQALQLLNGAFAQQQASAFAARLLQQAPDLRARLQLGYRLVAGREASAPALQRLLQLHADLQRDHARSDAEALQRCCLLLLNSNEFLFID